MFNDFLSTHKALSDWQIDGVNRFVCRCGDEIHRKLERDSDWPICCGYSMTLKPFEKNQKPDSNFHFMNDLAKQIHENNKAKGFYESEKNIGEMLALIHSEVSEALECDRKNQFHTHEPGYVLGIEDDEKFKDAFQRFIKDTFADELADIVIRVLDLAAFKGVEIEEHILAKMRYNSLRPYKHGKRY